ncbi:alpha-1,2-fucosyltransferase [Luteolibacter ambystomatis]|uniref:alpha-1,2-fucosyltransferase n=1 Tax=Luteolibacter ambystomatis TaxID=2824561 RepID=UPI0021F65C8C|nr:alpha-1,2-fucosyltransferase [Luteolibacter ambystomatis]
MIDPAFQLIGSEYVQQRGSPSGGAGYFLPRDMVAKIAADRTLPLTGAEDVIIGEAAVRLGAKALGSARLRMSATPFPRPENEVVTAHWCSPDRLRAVHAIYRTDPIRITRYRHPYWHDDILFYESGHFVRRATACSGTWTTDTSGTRHLVWYDWEEQIQIPSPPAVRSRVFDALHHHWSDMVVLHPDGTFQRASTSCGGRWTEADGVLLLNWAQWPSDTLKAEGDGYRSDSLVLKEAPSLSDDWPERPLVSDERISRTGEWNGQCPDHGCYDFRLGNAIAELLARQGCRSVVDCGCGSGRYTSLLRVRGFEAMGFDGNLETDVLSKGTCRSKNLSRPVELPLSDAAISLEVGEHIPAEYEDAFLDNLVGATRSLLVLSWAVPGQGGRGHVNLRPNLHLEEQLKRRGMVRWHFAEHLLREQCSIGWFRNSLMVYRRSPQSEDTTTLFAFESHPDERSKREEIRRSILSHSDDRAQICFFAPEESGRLMDEADFIQVPLGEQRTPDAVLHGFLAQAVHSSDFSHLVISTTEHGSPVGTNGSNDGGSRWSREEVEQWVHRFNLGLKTPGPTHLTVGLAGGMGNQMFQYAYALRLARQFGLPLKTTFLPLGRAFALRMFGIEPDATPSSPFEKIEYWDSYPGPVGWTVAGRIRESSTPEVLIAGYFQNEEYFLPVADEIRRLFKIEPHLPISCGERLPVAIHVRRGDFLTVPQHQVCGMDYYRRAMELMRNLVHAPQFIVVSDDPDWCSAEFGGADDVFVCGIQNEAQAMATFAGCRAFILSNSTFGWWGAWLANAAPVIAPDRFLNSREWQAWPDRWITIPASLSSPPKGPVPVVVGAKSNGGKEAVVTEHLPIRLGLLFLTRQDLNHPQLWKQFIDSADGEVAVFVHPKHPAEIRTPWLKEHVIRELHPTNWGDASLVRAMLALLKEAFRDATVTHFALLSESCIPIKAWHQIKTALQSDPRSRIDEQTIDRMSGSHRGRFQSSSRVLSSSWRVHSQWVLLDRQAASEILLAGRLNDFGNVFAADEHYFGTMLASRGYPDDKLNRSSAIWIRWAGSPVSFEHLDEALIEELRRFPGFFARKFPPQADIQSVRFSED